MTHHTRQCHTLLWDRLGQCIVSLQPVGVRKNRLSGYFVTGYVLHGESRCCSDHNAVTQPAGVANRPLQGLHPPQTATNDRGPVSDTQRLGKPRLCLYPVLNRHLRKETSPRLARALADTRGACGAIAAANIIRRDHKQAVCIDGLARTDHCVPPAWLCISLAVISRRMMTARQCMANKNGVTAVCV